jgi:hypothetical protein
MFQDQRLKNTSRIKKDVDAKDIQIPVVSDGKLSALAEDAVVPKRAV